ncbi:hypothetical protein QQX98_012107 [Neonectria punicea]|uniref:Uncharacterized protein n=1 Tax=Neonectria punicea TaxID=979145 RepID=A0ABR1GK19_9HYPO
MSIIQQTRDAIASSTSLHKNAESSRSVARLAEGLIMEDVKSQFVDNLEAIYDLWVGLLHKSTLPSNMASNDSRIVQVFQDLDKDSKSTELSISRLASVQLIRLMRSLKGRIKSDRRSGRVLPGKRGDSIAIDMFVNALGSPAGGVVARRQAIGRLRFDKRRASLAGQSPLLVITHTAKAERIIRDLNVSNKILDALAAETHGQYPTGLVQAAEYMTQIGELGETDVAGKRAHLEKLRDMIRQ